MTLRRTTVATTVAGLAMTIAGTMAGRAVDDSRQRARDASALGQATAAVRVHFAGLDNQVRDIAGLFEASRRVEPGEFRAFTRPMLRRSGANALTWIEQVPAARRAAVERGLGRPLRELSPAGAVRPAGRRSTYAVLRYGAFDRSGPSVVGVDVATDPRRADGLRRARRTGRVAAVTIPRLARHGDAGVVFFAPVLGPDGRWRGAASGAFLTSQFTQDMGRALGGAGVAVTIGGTTILDVGERHDEAPVRRFSIGGLPVAVRASSAPGEGTHYGSAALGAGLLLTLLASAAGTALRARRGLRHQADHDAITELLNRRGFTRLLETHLGAGRADGALMVIDLDHFKAVNDTLGHRVGDEVIDATGRALRACVRADDVVARIGGDEFAVLLPGADREHARATADRLVLAIGAEAQLAAMAGGHRVSASVGVVMLDASVSTPEEALMAADLAMYDAKAGGRRRAAFFDDGEGSGTRGRLRWVERLRRAHTDDGFVLVAQPIRSLADGATVHHELLLRLRADDGELVAPGAFLPIAEQFGLIGDIDRWVATAAIRTLAAHPDRELVFEVNLSGASLGSEELLATIRRELDAGAVDPRRIIFEITETAAVTNIEDAAAFARELTAIGCRFALDDFGVGFSSFSYLKRLPCDFLKIDGEFVQHSATSDADRVILESLVHVARGLHVTTIAEYVEDAATEALMAELGVDLVQGYHVGRPVDLEATIGSARRGASGSDR